MKSKQDDLTGRGFLPQGAEAGFQALPLAEKRKLLRNAVAVERTLGARLLCEKWGAVADELERVAEDLVQALTVETKLYPKIEICHALVAHREHTAPLLIAALGKIGKNQHQRVPEKAFRKKSYPLPRDIAARTLANMGESVLPELLKVLKSQDDAQLSEGLDAMGYICFYSDQHEVFQALKECYMEHCCHELICWKIVRAMSGFSQSVPFLLEQKAVCQNPWIQKEIERSLRYSLKKNR
jgi:hypothetical protein